MSENDLREDRPDVEVSSDKGGKQDALFARDYVMSHLDGSPDYADVSAEVLITLLVLNIVSNPEKVKVTVTKSVNTVILEYDVLDEDKGRLIGLDGRTIISIRQLVRAISGRSGKEYFVRMLEDGNPPNKRGRKRHHHPRRRPYHKRSR